MLGFTLSSDHKHFLTGYVLVYLALVALILYKPGGTACKFVPCAELLRLLGTLQDCIAPVWPVVLPFTSDSFPLGGSAVHTNIRYAAGNKRIMLALEALLVKYYIAIPSVGCFNV